MSLAPPMLKQFVYVMAALPYRPLQARRVAELLMMSFLHTMEIAKDGDIAFASMLDGRVWGLAPGGMPRVLGQVEGHAVAVASAPEGGWLVFGRRLIGFQTMLVHVLPDGSVAHVMDLPEIGFPNGVQRLPQGRYLLADSLKGIIWEIDFPRRSYAVWLKDDRLFSPIGFGVNGMAFFKDRLYITSTGPALILSLPVNEAGQPAGPVHVVKEGIPGDDFAFDVEGSMYITTHPMDRVLKLTPDGEITVVAGPKEGVRGCPACRFGRAAGDETGLYVLSDGGLFNPTSGGFQPAAVVRLEVGVAGAPVDLI